LCAQAPWRAQVDNLGQRAVAVGLRLRLGRQLAEVRETLVLQCAVDVLV
jgi:hypothetical protein